MSGQFINPILDESLLGDDKDRIENILPQPKQDEVDGYFGLAQPLLVKNCRVREGHHGSYRIELIRIRFELGIESRRPP